MSRVSGSRRRWGWRTAAVALVAVVTLLPATPGFGVVDIPELHGQEFPEFDSRTAEVAPSSTQREAATRLGAQVFWNQFGTPSSVIKHGGWLATGVQGKDAAEAARNWVETNKALFQLDSTDSLELVASNRLATSDGYAILFGQRIGDLPTSPDGQLTVGLTGNASSGWKVAYASSTLTGSEAATASLAPAGEAGLSPQEAWVQAAQDAGQDLSMVQITDSTERGQWTDLTVSGFAEPQAVRPVAFPSVRGAVPAYETVFLSDEGVGLMHIIDARDGSVLFRESIVHNLTDNPRWKVFRAYPRLGQEQYPWNYPDTDIRQIWCWLPGPGCQMALTASSPHPSRPYDTDGATGVPTNTTTGNNAMAQENWQDSFNPTLTGYRPVSPQREYIYPWQNTWFQEECDPATFQAGAEPDLPAAVTNLFVMHNRMHDWSYFLGFTEATWNAQEWNFGVNPAGQSDAIIGDVQAGGVVGGYPTYSGRDNANMATRPDGVNSWSNMYMWQPLAGSFYAPCVDGDFDMSVIGHEYGHMIENRMISRGLGSRQGFHAGAMGESFGDLNAMEYLREWGFNPVSNENPYAVGPYVTGNFYRGIRNYGMNFPAYGDVPRPSRYPFVNPLNFSDIGYDLTGPQVHADGEMWSATNFDIRRLFIQRYGGEEARQCASGQRPVTQCPGNRRWIQLYFDAMLLMPRRPTFLDARNAILAADQTRFGGANQDLLWRAFAWRGMGESAFNADAEDRQPKPAFDSPQESEGTVRFRAFDKETGAPVNANVYVGHYEGRVSPIADTNPSTGPADGTQPVDASNLDNVASFVPRTYEFVANAQGYGHVRFRSSIQAGRTRNITIRFAPNWASQFKGAVATGDGTRHGSLIDDTEASNWESTGAPVQGRQVTVALGGGEHKLKEAAVSAHLVPEVNAQEVPQSTQNRFTALRQFELRGCAAGEDAGNPGCSGTDPDGWTVLYRSASNFFPGDTPRPTAPDLILRGFDLRGGGHDDDDDDRRGRHGNRYTHVQLVVLNNQCTGNPDFQGEQDQDPLNVTDCRTGSPGSPLVRRDLDVRAAELQVFSAEHQVIGTGGGDDDDDDDDDD